MAPGAGWWWRRWRMWWLLLGVGVCVWTPSVQPRREDIPRENLGFPTATEGEADTTHTTWGLSLINADKYGAYTWPELFLADLVYRWRESTPFWPPEKKMEWPQDRSTPPNISDPKMKEFPAFDPWVWRTTTEVPSRKYGQVLLAQGYYMLVQLNGDYESCTQLIFEEKIYEFFQVKDCLPSYNKKWFWTYPWLPDMIHNLRVKDRSSKKVLFIESYYSLPEEPPKIEIDVKNGMGFVEITFVPPYEKGPSLNGYVVFYRNTLEGRVRDRWLDVLSMYVVYNERFPYVRPTHPCEEFRDDRTFCILVLDHVGPIEYSRAADRIYFQLSTFRIVPGPWRPYFVIHWNRYPWAHVCYFTREWHCPEMMGSGGKAYDYPHREKYRPMTTPKSTTKSEKHVVIGGNDDLHTFPNSTNGPALLRGLKNEDLCVIFAGLTLLLLLIGGPLAYFLGQHSGKTAAEDRWARLASQPGVVSVPLGHGGAFWRGRSSLPGNPAPPQ